MRRFFVYGAFLASVALIVSGLASVGAGVYGKRYVEQSLADEKIVGTPDSDLKGEKIDTGAEAKAFAEVMRKHTLEATEGKTYAEMGRFLTADGEETSDENEAAKDESGQPVENGLRNMWVTETALSTALNMAYFAQIVSLFSVMVGVGMVLTGIGFLVITFGALKMPRDQ